MNVQEKAGFLDRTLRNLRNGWRTLASVGYDAERASCRPDLPDNDLEHLRMQMQACLQVQGGAVSARARSAALGHVYLALDEIGKTRFLKTLNDEFGTSRAAIRDAIDKYNKAEDPFIIAQAELDLRRTLESPRIALLRQFNELPDGVKFLVDMRATLLKLIPADPSLRSLEQDLKDLLSSWFDIGFLELRCITWDTASAALLEKLIAYEAVHAISSWDDLKNRLDSDRRCFAYFHPKMPDEPLIFVEVALVNGLAGNVQALLDKDAPVQDPTGADTAIFYSINNAQRGLAGISFGNFLIKKVAAELSREFDGLKTFSTLSPIPGFVRWLDQSLSQGTAGLLTSVERKSLSTITGKLGGKGALKKLLNREDWVEDAQVEMVLKPIILRLCARYLTLEKQKDGRVLDPVAHFHLSNGAIIERINWLGDTSRNGVEQAAGMMINYLYDLESIDANHEAYAGSSKITVSSDIKGLL